MSLAAAFARNGVNTFEDLQQNSARRLTRAEKRSIKRPEKVSPYIPDENLIAHVLRLAIVADVQHENRTNFDRGMATVTHERHTTGPDILRESVLAKPSWPRETVKRFTLTK